MLKAEKIGAKRSLKDCLNIYKTINNNLIRNHSKHYKRYRNNWIGNKKELLAKKHPVSIAIVRNLKIR